MRDYFQPTVETLGVVALHFPHGTLKISDPKPREELDVTAVVIDQAPVRGAIGEFAYVLYLHWASAQKGRVGATGLLTWTPSETGGAETARTSSAGCSSRHVA